MPELSEDPRIRQLVQAASHLIDTSGLSNVTVSGCTRALAGFDGCEISAFPSLDPPGETLTERVDALADRLLEVFRDFNLRRLATTVEDGIAFTHLVIG